METVKYLMKFTTDMAYVVIRNAKTAPSTPEAEQRVLVQPRHAESTSQLEMLRTHHIARTPSSPQYSALPGDLAIKQQQPEKLNPPKRKKSRNEKFHKLFKTIPAEETVLKCYSCAYFGDILLQGYLYVSPNYFCFYSNILGHAKQIQIHVRNVLNISREKTAIIIPNAIGILTPQDKYVFGSLMSRDNTYRFLCQLLENTRGENGLAMPRTSDMDFESLDNNNKPSISVDTPTVNTSGEGEEEDEEDDEEEDDVSGTSEEDSVCMQCSQPRDSSTLHSCTMTTTLTANNVAAAAPLTPTNLGAPVQRTPSTPSPRNSSFAPQKTQKTSSVAPAPSPVSAATTATAATSAGTSNGLHKSRAPVQSEASQGQSWGVLQLLPSISSQSSTLITISSVLVLVLSISAMLMAYKIVLLQAKIDGALPYDGLTGHEVYKDMYYINDQYHTATIRRFHTVLEANIHILDQVYSSLRSLQRPVAASSPPPLQPPPQPQASSAVVKDET